MSVASVVGVLKEYVNFIFELGHMRYVPRSGWEFLRMKFPENDAEHVARVAQIAFILAKLEGHPNPHYVATLGLFHENGETRTGDPNSVSKKYVVVDEKRAVVDQTAHLGWVGAEISDMCREVRELKTWAGRIAKDADRLEMMFTAKELMESGYSAAVLWINNSMPLLFTDSAKKLARELENASPNDWWIEIQDRK